MINFDFDKYCCGCEACSNTCPTEAITIIKDKNGFAMPSVNKDKCINCNKCDKVCPHLNAEKYDLKDNKDPVSWLYASGDDDAKMRSASGGAFYELAKYAIENGYYICGCVWNENMEAEHILTNTYDGLCKMQGSKYVQSGINNILSQMLTLIKNGERVLFSGTPCQCVSAHNFIKLNAGNLMDKLVTVGLICHGVASPKAWTSFKAWFENKHGSKLVAVNFRDKSREGYKKSYCRYKFENGKEIYNATYLPTSKYIEATLVYNLAMRNSCGNCDCKGVTSACDIIIGDWYAIYEGEGRLGTSCITVFTERGENYAKTSLKNLRAFTYKEILKRNALIETSTPISPNRDKFLSELDDISMWDKVEKYYPPKYPVKRFLCKTGLFGLIKKLKG